MGGVMMTVLDFFDYHVRNAAWCLRKGFPKRMLLCDVWFKDIPRSTRFDHPYGITIRRGVKIGENCTFASNVTIGQRRKDEVGCAVIGNNVYFGTGSTVIGEVKIGDNVTLGAMTLVLKDIPENTVYVGKSA